LKSEIISINQKLEKILSLLNDVIIEPEKIETDEQNFKETPVVKIEDLPEIGWEDVEKADIK